MKKQSHKKTKPSNDKPALILRMIAQYLVRSPLKVERLLKKRQVKIRGIVRQTAGGRHFWCESNVGLIRKPISGVPKSLLRRYDER